MAAFWIVDRIENNIVVLEAMDKSHSDVPLSLFPDTVKEGDVVILREDGTYKTDEAKTKARKAKLFELQKKIFGES